MPSREGPPILTLSSACRTHGPQYEAILLVASWLGPSLPSQRHLGECRFATLSGIRARGCCLHPLCCRWHTGNRGDPLVCRVHDEGKRTPVGGWGLLFATVLVEGPHHRVTVCVADRAQSPPSSLEEVGASGPLSRVKNASVLSPLGGQPSTTCLNPHWWRHRLGISAFQVDPRSCFTSAM